MTDLPALSRRTVLTHAGLAAAAVAGLSGCSSDGPGGSAAGSTPPPGGAVSAADVPVGGGTIFPDLQAVVTQPAEGEFKAFSFVCTHQNCPVTEVTDTINCKCHGSRFALADGAVLNPPATQPLAARTVTVSGDSLTVS